MFTDHQRQSHRDFALGAGLILIPAFCTGIASLAGLCGATVHAAWIVAAMVLALAW